MEIIENMDYQRKSFYQRDNMAPRCSKYEPALHVKRLRNWFQTTKRGTLGQVKNNKLRWTRETRPDVLANETIGFTTKRGTLGLVPSEQITELQLPILALILKRKKKLL